MFNSDLVIYIAKDRLLYGDIKGSKVKALKWDGGSLTTHLKKLNPKNNKDIKIIAGESASYVLVKPTDIDKGKEAILSSAFAEIPDNLTTKNTQWQVVNTDKKKNTQWIEYLVVANQLTEAVKGNKKIEGFYPISKLIAHIFRKQTKPVLCIWKGPETVAVVCFKGVVYLSSKSVGIKKGEISSIIKQAKDEFNIDLKHIVTNWKKVSDILKLPKGWKLEIKSFDPISEIKKIASSDREKYILESVSDEKSQQLDIESEQSSDESERSKTKILLVVLIVILASTIAAAYYWLNIRSTDDDTSEQENSELSDIKQTDESEPEVSQASESAVLQITQDQQGVDYADYSLLVENGSGIAGAAGEIADRLESLGFVGIETGNADSFDYQGLTIAYKADIDEALLNAIREEFSEYVITEAESLEVDDIYDLKITLGLR